MIQAWFNERGFYMQGERGEGRFVYDLPPDVVSNASMTYMCRWMVLNRLLNDIDTLGETTQDKDLVLHTDSRLIEELKGGLAPTNEFAQSSLQYFRNHDYRKFRRVTFMKSAATTINHRLSLSVHPTRPQ